MVVEGSIGVIESCIYVLVGVLLVAAAASIVVGTTSEGVGSLGEASAIDTGVLVLDRILLLFIIAELLFTLRLTISRGEILVEPFLFIGLIAVVRRVLVITAESEGAAIGGPMLTNFLLELGVLALLALSLSIAIYLLRHSASRPRRSRSPARFGGGPGAAGPWPLPVRRSRRSIESLTLRRPGTRPGTIPLRRDEPFRHQQRRSTVWMSLWGFGCARSRGWE